MDFELASNLKLKYRGRVEADSEVKVEYFVIGDGVFIPAQNLQWGYKVYGPEYNLLDSVNMDCLGF